VVDDDEPTWPDEDEPGRLPEFDEDDEEERDDDEP
jgi:hypothetical protein